MTYQIVIIVSKDIDFFIMPFSSLMAEWNSSETNWHTKRMTGNDNK